MDDLAVIRREQILAIFLAGVAAAYPYEAVKNSLQVVNDELHIRLNLLDATKQRTGNWKRIHLLAFGKAACPMLAAAQAAIPAALLENRGLAVTTYENVSSLTATEVLGAGHPLPDAAGWLAAQRVAQRVRSALEGDLVLALVSGGASALLPYPVSAITLQEKIDTTNLLLASGANINEINCVRKHLSQLKGGGLAKFAAPADLHALILSDVLGDDVSVIASGPTVADHSRFSDAIDVLHSYQLWDQVPVAVQTYLQQGAQHLQAETPKPNDSIFQQNSYSLIGSNSISIQAAIKTSNDYNYQTTLYSKHLYGEAKLVAAQLAEYAKSIQDDGPQQPTALIAGGETTVSLSGNGKGGRNQEMALAFAITAEKLGLDNNWTFLSAGTDGRDGPTDAAGGIVDANSLTRMRQAGLEPIDLLSAHNSYPALQAAKDLLITGPTGTNVADLQIILLHPVKA